MAAAGELHGQKAGVSGAGRNLHVHSSGVRDVDQEMHVQASTGSGAGRKLHVHKAPVRGVRQKNARAENGANGVQ
jgi:hypothetical protein